MAKFNPIARRRQVPTCLALLSKIGECLLEAYCHIISFIARFLHPKTPPSACPRAPRTNVWPATRRPESSDDHCSGGRSLRFAKPRREGLLSGGPTPLRIEFPRRPFSRRLGRGYHPSARVVDEVAKIDGIRAEPQRFPEVTSYRGSPLTGRTG